MRMRRSTPLAALLGGLLGLSACGPEFAEEEKIEGYRVLGVQAEPPEVDPDGVVTLTLLEHDTEAPRPIRYAWEVCLVNTGDVGGFACVDPQFEVPLPSVGPTAQIDFGPSGLNVRALYAAFGPFPGADGRPVTLADGFDVYVHVVSAAEGGREVSTYKRVRIRDAEALNRNPTVARIEADGAPLERSLKPGETVELEAIIDESTRDVRPDGATEVYTYRWFAVDGVIDDGFGPQTAIVDYTAPAAPGEDLIFVVVRDGQGGSVLETLPVTIAE